MSLEDALAANTAAKLENTAALISLSEIMARHNELIGNLATRVPGAAAPKTDTAKSGETGTAEPKETAAQKKAREKAAADANKKALEEAAKKTPTITLEGLRDQVGGWLAASTKGSAEYEAKREELRKIVTHFGAEKLTELPADKVAEAHSFFEQIKNGEDPFPADESEEEAEVDPLL